MKNTCYWFVFFLLAIYSMQLDAQTVKGTNFYGTTNNADICEQSGSFYSDSDVERLVTEMLAKTGAKNRYILQSCSKIDNCQAVVFYGKPYILYNSAFLNGVKTLRFATVASPSGVTNQDWRVLGILAHELGHHVNNHLTNRPLNISQRELELEADEYAGYILYLMDATLQQAQSCVADLPENGSYTHPGRTERLRAFEKGYKKAKALFGKSMQIIEEEPEIYTIVDEMPEFPGGQAGLFAFLKANTYYPPYARYHEIEGTVYVGFVIMEDGSVADVKVKRGLPGGGGGCDDEAVRVVKMMPKWKPGIQRGKPVRVAYTLPFKFMLE